MSDTGGHRRARLAADALQQHILGEGVAAGVRLGTIAQLRRIHDVAAATMTEAVRLLEQRGLVQVRKGRGGGVFVAAPSPQARLSALGVVGAPQDPRHVRQVRQALEPALAEDAARACGELDARELEFLLERLAGRADDPPAYADACRALHRRLADGAANPLLRGLYLTLLDLDDTVPPDARADLRHQRELVAAVTGRRLVRAAGAGRG
jgi:GntR family transcriptional regulator, transcriptional repressor for pyruvate dehydrogenase complex